MSKKTFVKGAVVLGIAGLLVQVMGAIFRIPLANIIGDEGMGYYQTAYPIYLFLLIFSTNGAPAAISKMTSEKIAIGNYREAHRIFKLAFIFMVGFGLIAFFLILLGAEKIVNLVGNPGAAYAMRAIAPALLFIPIMSVYRGYFQGMQEMGPTATSQLIEQGIRVACGLTLGIMLVPYGISYAAAGATAGTSIGPLFGILVLMIIYQKKKTQIKKHIEGCKYKEQESSASILKTLAVISIPITVGVSIMPIINLGDFAFVMTRLQDIGYSSQEANALYGQLTGMALPIVNIPMALALSMALSMVPAIASAKSIGDEEFLRTNIKLGLRTSMIIGIPCSLGLMSLSEPIMRLLYPLKMEAAVNSSSSLFIVSIGIVFLCIAQTMAGILQGLGRPALAVYGLFAGFAVKCTANYVLVGIPSLNIDGAAWGSVLGFATIGILNFIAVNKCTKIKYDIALSVVKPLFAGISMFMLVKIVYMLVSGILGNSLSTVISIGAGAALYGILLLKLGAIKGSEIEMMPKGKKIVILLKKMKLV